VKRQVFLGCENNPRALCFAGLLGVSFSEILRAADLGDAFAQAWMAVQAADEQRFEWDEKSGVLGERDGFCYLGNCYQFGKWCEKDLERARENYLVAAQLQHVHAMVCLSDLLDKDDPQRSVWLGRAAVNGDSYSFLNEMSVQVRNISYGTGCASVVFVIGRALKGHINNEKGAIFGNRSRFDARIGPANQALNFYNFQLQSYRKVIDIWTVIALRNRVVRDIRKMIGKMIKDAREKAAYLEKKQSDGDLRARSNSIKEQEFIVALVKRSKIENVKVPIEKCLIFLDIFSSYHEWFCFALSSTFSWRSSTTPCLVQDS
jgi:hypothetical protein